jgi:hypothetical protein
MKWEAELGKSTKIELDASISIWMSRRKFFHFLQSINIKGRPACRRRFSTLRKPGKSDYTIPSAYHPIAEEEGLGKVLESVVADWLSGFAEVNGLLSANQFGGRPGRSAVDALLLITQKVKDAW